MTPQPSALAALKRYTIEAHAVFGTLVAEALERDWGEYVRWNDVLAAWPTQPQGVPDGWKLVPLGTSWDMRNECRELLIDFGVKAERLDALSIAIWQSMTDAAPTPPVNPSPSTAALREALRECASVLFDLIAWNRIPAKLDEYVALDKSVRTLLAGDKT